MSGRSQHVVPNSKGEWVVRRSGSARATRVFESRHRAVEYAKRLAQKSGAELYIHRATVPFRPGLLRVDHSPQWGTDAKSGWFDKMSSSTPLDDDYLRCSGRTFTSSISVSDHGFAEELDSGSPRIFSFVIRKKKKITILSTQFTIFPVAGGEVGILPPQHAF